MDSIISLIEALFNGVFLLSALDSLLKGTNLSSIQKRIVFGFFYIPYIRSIYPEQLKVLL